VDLNAEAIQICQLSLWIKTVARGKRLTSLGHTSAEAFKQEQPDLAHCLDAL
jgi:hypothetical protein